MLIECWLPMQVYVKCSLVYMDFEGRSDGGSIKKILSHVSPLKLVSNLLYQCHLLNMLVNLTSHDPIWFTLVTYHLWCVYCANSSLLPLLIFLFGIIHAPQWLAKAYEIHLAALNYKRSSSKLHQIDLTFPRSLKWCLRLSRYSGSHKHY